MQQESELLKELRKRRDAAGCLYLCPVMAERLLRWMGEVEKSTAETAQIISSLRERVQSFTNFDPGL